MGWGCFFKIYRYIAFIYFQLLPTGVQWTAAAIATTAVILSCKPVPWPCTPLFTRLVSYIFLSFESVPVHCTTVYRILLLFFASPFLRIPILNYLKLRIRMLSAVFNRKYKLYPEGTTAWGEKEDPEKNRRQPLCSLTSRPQDILPKVPPSHPKHVVCVTVVTNCEEIIVGRT